MRKTLVDFAASLGLTLSASAAETLVGYADLVWEKKDFLNLTSVRGKEEIFTRHLCDGLAAAALCGEQMRGKENFTAADLGAGAGYVGLTLAAALPQARVSLVECLEKRCSFLNWAVLKLGLKNAGVKCLRLGQKQGGEFDFVTERAMGKINDILPLAVSCVRPCGVFAPYQSDPSEADAALLKRLGLCAQPPRPYILPGETKTRYLAVFRK